MKEAIIKKDTIYLSSAILPSVYEEIRLKANEYKIIVKTVDVPNNLWIRDYMPIKSKDGELVRYTYRPDYLTESKYYNKYLVNTSQLALEKFTGKIQDINLILDGGNFVQLGDRYIAMTEKVFHENPSLTKDEIEGRLKDAFHSKIIWLPWDEEEMFGHADGMINWLDGKVIITNYHDFDKDIADEIKKRLSKAGLNFIELKYKFKRGFHKRSWCYINFLQANDLVLMPRLGADEDEEAIEQLAKLTTKKIETINALPLIRRGGGIHCATWEYTTKE